MFMDSWPPNWTLTGVRSKPIYRKRGKNQGGQSSCFVLCRKHKNGGRALSDLLCDKTAPLK